MICTVVILRIGKQKKKNGQNQNQIEVVKRNLSKSLSRNEFGAEFLHGLRDDVPKFD